MKTRLWAAIITLTTMGAACANSGQGPATLPTTATAPASSSASGMSASAGNTAPALFEPRFAADGALMRPNLGYRRWVHAGTPLTPHDMNGGKAAFPDFHPVYIDPAALAGYERTGAWPDGTVLVKELVSVKSKRASSGHGYFMGEHIGLEVAIKDNTRFPEAPGNWAYFSFGHEYPLANQTMAQPEAACASCHEAAADDDMVFTQYYPVLRAAKGNPSPAGPAEIGYTDAGELIQPTGYRKWMYIGTPITPNDMNKGKAAFPEFHTVYIAPSAYRAWSRTGELPEGTVIVKELAGVGTKAAESGNGYFMGDFTGLEVMVKDSKRYPDEPGGWAFFSFGHEYPLAGTAKPMPQAACSSCHASLAKSDLVFTQYYPVLTAARGK